MKLSCHCGAVHIEIDKQPESLTSCNCSICNRYGALWGYYQPNEVSLTIKGPEISKYSWGEKSINFCFCSECGCVTHYESNSKKYEPRTAVNFRMAEPSAIETLRIRKFDGADTWSFID